MTGLRHGVPNTLWSRCNYSALLKGSTMSKPVRQGTEVMLEKRHACNGLTVGVPKEIYEGERRVALAPANVPQLKKKGFNVIVESGAGAEADFPDAMYKAQGAEIVSKEAAFSADIVLKVRPPQEFDDKHEVDLFKEGATLISLIYPAQNGGLLERFRKHGVTVFAADCVPRLTRAQVYDVLSSMNNIAGYKAVLEAANTFGRYFKQTITAAGKVCNPVRAAHTPVVCWCRRRIA